MKADCKYFKKRQISTTIQLIFLKYKNNAYFDDVFFFLHIFSMWTILVIFFQSGIHKCVYRLMEVFPPIPSPNLTTYKSPRGCSSFQ